MAKIRFRGRIIVKIGAALIVGFLSYLTIDYIGPRRIHLYEDQVFGFTCFHAKDLIVQEYDENGDLWATRGMIIYKLEKGEERFQKVAHIPTGLNPYWLRNFTIVRRLSIRPECVEMVTTASGDICALSAGQFWIRHQGEGRFQKTMEIDFYGFGDQGVRNAGLLSLGDSAIYFGEYFQNADRTEAVRIWRTGDDFRDWQVVHRFEPGAIRHIHAVQYDPYGEKIWVLTGDGDEESSVLWTGNDFRSVQGIGTGSQVWRVCQLVFTEEEVIWGTDNGSEELAGIYRWERQQDTLEKLIAVDGAVFYGTRLSNGAIIFSTDREGFDIEKDDRTRLHILHGDEVSTVVCGTWKHHNPGFWFKFAKLRFQRSSGNEYLAITVLNQEELRDGDLILIHQNQFTPEALTGLTE